MVRRSWQPPKLVVMCPWQSTPRAPLSLEMVTLLTGGGVCAALNGCHGAVVWIVVRSLPPAGVRVWVVRPLAGCLSGLFYSVQPIRGIDLSYIYTLNAAKKGQRRSTMRAVISPPRIKTHVPSSEMWHAPPVLRCISLVWERLRKIWTFTPARQTWYGHKVCFDHKVTNAQCFPVCPLFTLRTRHSKH